MSNPAAVAMPVEDAGDGRWMSMVSTCLVINFTTTVLLVNHFDGQTFSPPPPPLVLHQTVQKNMHTPHA
jgi:hypothetical protein